LDPPKNGVLADFFTQELPSFVEEGEIDPNQQYTGHSCHNDDHVGKVSLCAGTNTLGRLLNYEL